MPAVGRHDPTGAGPAEVGADDQQVGVGDVGDEVASRALAPPGVGVEVRAPLGRCELHGVVHEVAGDQRRGVAGRQAHAAVAGRVARRRHQRHARRDLGVDVDEIDEPGVDDRLDGVEELGRVVVRLAAQWRYSGPAMQ